MSSVQSTWPLNQVPGADFRCVQVTQPNQDTLRCLFWGNDISAWHAVEYNFHAMRECADRANSKDRCGLYTLFNPNDWGGALFRVIDTTVGQRHCFWVDIDGLHQHTKLSMDPHTHTIRAIQTDVLCHQFHCILYHQQSETFFALKFNGDWASVWVYHLRCGARSCSWYRVYRWQCRSVRLSLGTVVGNHYLVCCGSGDARGGSGLLQVIDLESSQKVEIDMNSKLQYKDEDRLSDQSHFMLHLPSADKRIVPGFVREHQTKYQPMHIPLVLRALIHKYYVADGQIVFYDCNWRRSKVQISEKWLVRIIQQADWYTGVMDQGE